MPAFARRIETGPWFEAGAALDGEAVCRKLREDRQSGAWLRPYCVYVHVPFCRSICPYCALYTHAIPRGADRVLDEYVEAVERSLDAHPWTGHPQPPTTVHFGGGTPLSLGLRRFSALVAAIGHAFGRSADCEWAIETTVSALDAETIEVLGRQGFRRVHLGIQTLDDATRRRMGRAGDGAAVVRRIRDLVERGFFPSADLIIGFEGVGGTVVRDDLRRLFDAGIRMFSICELRERGGAQVGSDRDHERARFTHDLWREIWAFMDVAGLQPIHLGQFARSPSDNLYYTHPARRENCVALGPYAHGSAGDLYYGNLLLPEYYAALGNGRSAVAQGVEYRGGARLVRELERSLLAQRLPADIVEAVIRAYPASFPPMIDTWLRGGLLVDSEMPGEWTLSREGSWFVGNMILQARALWEQVTAGCPAVERTA